jgi:hypothetical protein
MKIGRIRRFLTAFSFCCIASSGMAAGEDGAGLSPVAPQVQELQEKMVSDPGIMAQINLLLNDPEIQALLSDSKVQESVKAGDVGALLQNPRFMRILSNPRVKEIEKRLENQGSGGTK